MKSMDAMIKSFNDLKEYEEIEEKVFAMKFFLSMFIKKRSFIRRLLNYLRVRR